MEQARTVAPMATEAPVQAPMQQPDAATASTQQCASAAAARKQMQQHFFDACSRGDEGRMRRLLHAGASPDRARPDGTALCVALRAATENGQEGAVRLLLEAGADAGRACGEDGSTAVAPTRLPRARTYSAREGQEQNTDDSPALVAL